MTELIRRARSFVGLTLAILATTTLAAQTTGNRPVPTPVPKPAQTAAQTEAAQIQQVRVAIGRGKIADARRLADAIPGSAGRDLASALVDIFEGKDDAARTKLEPLARVNPVGDAALELGLLELRHGQRDEGWRRLDPIAAVRTFNGPDDYHRLARAAIGIREFKLAADAYTETAAVPRADIQSDRGDLFLMRHKNGDAATDYRKALALDPQWLPAMLGLARALADENPMQADALMNGVQKVAPNHPGLWQLAAEVQIQREDKSAALESVDKLAAARPGTIEEFALRAAIAYANNDTAAMTAAMAKADAIDARSALALRMVGEQAARDYRFDEAVKFAQQATVRDGDDPAAFFDLGLYLMRTGDERGARTAFERSWALDMSANVTKNMLDVLDKVDAFETVTSGDLVLKFAKAEAPVLKTYAVPLAEEAMKTFGARYGFTPQGPILIEVFPMHDDFAVRTLGLPGLVGALGACFGRVIAMDSPSARDPGEFSWQATLWHEMAHVYTLQLSKYRVPRWLTEGISVFEEHRRQPAWGRELTLQFAANLGKGETFGVKKLPEAFKHPESLALAYFEASLLVEHLVALHGDAGLRTLLLAYADGAKDTDAFAKAFGRSVDEVETSFKKFVDDNYGTLSKALADPPVKVAADDLAGLRLRAQQAPGNFASQHALGAAFINAGLDSEARAPLEKAAELAPQATGLASPHALLALTAERAGDLDRARRELRRLLTFDHENVVAARKLAALAGDAPAAADDRDYALRLIADLDPFDAPTHVQLGRRLLAKGNYAPALLEFRAAMALGPPNLAEAYTDISETLFKLGRKEEAKRQVILALEQAPVYARAQELLLAILGRN
jgi:tetratricopeptide (TPR) repeat protein